MDIFKKRFYVMYTPRKWALPFEISAYRSPMIKIKILCIEIYVTWEGKK